MDTNQAAALGPEVAGSRSAQQLQNQPRTGPRCGRPEACSPCCTKTTIGVLLQQPRNLRAGPGASAALRRDRTKKRALVVDTCDGQWASEPRAARATACPNGAVQKKQNRSTAVAANAQLALIAIAGWRSRALGKLLRVEVGVCRSYVYIRVRTRRPRALAPA